jgi:hypothetical protein
MCIRVLTYILPIHTCMQTWFISMRLLLERRERERERVKRERETWFMSKRTRLLIAAMSSESKHPIIMSTCAVCKSQ